MDVAAAADEPHGTGASGSDTRRPLVDELPLSFAGQSVRRKAEAKAAAAARGSDTAASDGELPPLKRDPRPDRLPANTSHEECNLCPHGVEMKDPVPQPRSHKFLWHVLNSRPLHEARCHEIQKANRNAPDPDPGILNKPWHGLLTWYIKNSPDRIESAADLYDKFLDKVLPPPPGSLSWAHAPYAIRFYVVSKDGAAAKELPSLDDLTSRAKASREPVLIVKAPCMRSDGSGVEQVRGTPYGVFAGHICTASSGAGISFVILMEMRPVECYHRARPSGAQRDKIASCHPAHKQELQPGADWFFLVGGGLLRLLRANGVDAIVLGVGKAATFSMQDSFGSCSDPRGADDGTPPGIRTAARGLVVIDNGVLHTSEARFTSGLEWFKYGAAIAVAAAVLRGGGGGAPSGSHQGAQPSCGPGQRAFLETLEKSPMLVDKTATPFLNMWLRLVMHCASPRARHKRGGALWWAEMSASALPLLTSEVDRHGASVLRVARELSEVAGPGSDLIHELWSLLPGADLDLVRTWFHEKKATCSPSELVAYNHLLLKRRGKSDSDTQGRGEEEEDEWEEDEEDEDWDEEEDEDEEDEWEEEEENAGTSEGDEYSDEEDDEEDDWGACTEDIIVDTEDDGGNAVTVAEVIRDAVEVLRQAAKEAEEPQLAPDVEEKRQRLSMVFNPPAHCGGNCCGEFKPHRSPGTTWAMHRRRHFLEAIGRESLGSLTDQAKQGIAKACRRDSPPLVQAAAGIKTHLERYRVPLRTTSAAPDNCSTDRAPIAPERLADDLAMTDEEARLLTHARFYVWCKRTHCLVRVLSQEEGIALWTSKDKTIKRYFVLGSCGRSRDNASFHDTHTGGFMVLASMMATATDPTNNPRYYISVETGREDLFYMEEKGRK